MQAVLEGLVEQAYKGEAGHTSPMRIFIVLPAQASRESEIKAMGPIPYAHVQSRNIASFPRVEVVIELRQTAVSITPQLCPLQNQSRKS